METSFIKDSISLSIFPASIGVRPWRSRDLAVIILDSYWPAI